MVKKSFLLGILMVIVTALSGQPEDHDVRYRERRFDNFKSVFENPVNVIRQDRQGAIWFSSGKDFSRFDGTYLKTFLDRTDSSLKKLGPVREIIDLGADRFGINMVTGVLLFDQRTGRFELLFTDQNIQELFHTKITPVINRIFYDDPFIWIGTNTGLLRFDTREKQLTGLFEIFEDHAGDPNNIREIVPAKEDQLWISTGYSVHLFNTERSEFSNDIMGRDIQRKYRDLRLENDDYGNLWLGYGGNVYFYSLDAGSLTLEINNLVQTATGRTPEGNIFNLDSVLWNSAVMITKIIVKDDGQLLISSHKHIIHYDPESRTLNIIFSTNDGSGKTDKILNTYLTEGEDIWISTENQGIIYLSPNRYSVKFIRDEMVGYEDIIGSIYNIDVFDGAEIWAGRGKGKGLVKMDLVNNTVQEYPAEGLQYEITRRVIKDRSGNIWAIADGGIIYSLDPVRLKYQYFHCPDTLSKQGQWLLSLVMDDFGFLWAAGPGGGLIKLDKEKGNYWIFNDIYSNSNGFQLKPVWQILKHKKNEFLLFSNHEVIQLKIEPAIADDGTVTYEHAFSNYLGEQIDEILPKIRQSKLITGFVDSNENLWIGTDGSGAVKYSKRMNDYWYYNTSNGLPSDVVKSILEDSYGNIWMATDKGFSRFNPEEEIIDNVFFWKDSEYPNKQVDWWDGHTDNQGILYYGILEDPMILEPVNFQDWKASDRKIFFSDLRINNRSQRPYTDPTISCLVNYQPDIHMDHTQHLFSLDYTVLDFNYAGKYRYRYKLEGFDQDWIETEYNTNITYSNLPSGKYRLIVNFSDSDQFNEKNIAYLNVYKAPAPWNTWWARLGYFLIASMTGFVFLFLVIKRKKIQRKLEQEHLELEKIKEIEEAKSRFFTQLSHEIRTPLSLILQPVESLARGEARGKEYVFYNIIRRNANRLKDLLNQMLDLSRLNSGRMTIRVSRKDIVEFMRLRVANFESLAESKELNLSFNSPVRDLYVYFDGDKIEKVINNLLSNAIKFTPAGGKIKVSVLKEEGNSGHHNMYSGSPEDDHFLGNGAALITVADTGIGIASEYQERIYDRFYQACTENDHEGLGIGLSLSREMVYLHHGKILVRSKPGEGSTFLVYLPIGKSHFTADQLESDNFEEKQIKRSETRGDIRITKYQKQESGEQVKPIILYIEDNEDLLDYLQHAFESDYTFIGAWNGSDGLRTAQKIIPDLIISDVMMPGLNGMEVCRQLKEDPLTRHIPVFLLTARSGNRNKVSGLETGADDYIVKPFDVNELRLRIRNQLIQLERLREKYVKSFILDESNSVVTSRDDAFLTELINIVQKKLEDHTFNVSNLSREMGISRSLLYRKMKALTGKKPNEFIRMIRLRKAAELLAVDSGNISEIAYAVGFNNISYFSRSFYAMYQMTPSKYIKSGHVLKQD